MVVADLNVFGLVVSPFEADAPLFVDADGVLAFAVALECFELIAGRDAEIIEFVGSVEHA